MAGPATAQGTPDDVLIVANPYSGSGRYRDRVEALGQALGNHGLTARTLWRLDDASPLGACTCRHVVAAGGDGTVATVVNALMARGQSGPAVAVLPLGTENLLARELGFTTDVERLAEAIARGPCRRVDLGRTGDRYFTLMLSAGFDAEVAHRLARHRARSGQLHHIRHATYARPLLAAALRYRFDPVELVPDDGRSYRGSEALVFNVARYGLGLPFAPDARIDDGLLHWVVFEKPGRARLLAYLTAVLRRRHLRRSDVHHGTARHVRIHSDKPVPVQIDGDAAGFTPVSIDIEPRAVAFVDTAAGAA